MCDLQIGRPVGRPNHRLTRDGARGPPPATDISYCKGSLMRVWPGRPYPLGATWDGAGVNFSLFSEHAAKVELCLFDSVEAATESQRIALPECTDMVWHAYLPDVQPDQLYRARAHGP